MSQTVSADRPAAPATSAAAAPAVEIVGLRKEYGGRVALHDLSLAVQPGEVFGFLGPNGAGKTTTVKILTGLVRPSAGEARIFGSPAGEPAARGTIGYLPEHFRFHDWLSGAALLDFHGRLAGLTAAERRARIPAVLARVGLAGRGDERLRHYSKGMTQRIGLAQAILHRPRLVLLDEPTSALDPVGRREVRDLVRTLRDEGVAVFLNSHLLTEIELVCDRVAIVDRGRVVRAGRLADLIGSPELRVTVDRVDAPLLAALAAAGEVLAVDGTVVTLAVPEPEAIPRVADAVVRAGYRLYGLVPGQRSLEDVFVALVGGGDGDSALTIARFTVQEAISRRLVLAGVLVSLVFVALFALGFAFLYGEALKEAAFRPATGNTRVVFAGAALTVLGLYTVYFLSSFLALFLSVGAISGEIDSGLLHAVLARPIRRGEFVLGRWLGFAGLLTAYVAVMAGVLLGLARLIAGYEAPDSGRTIALMLLGALLLLTVSLLGSTLLSTLANGVVGFSLFGVAWLAGFIEYLGGLLANDAMVNLGTAVSLLLPSDAIWRSASYYVQSPASLAMATSGLTLPFASAAPPAPPLIVWALGYLLLGLAGAVAAFSRRDL